MDYKSVRTFTPGEYITYSYVINGSKILQNILFYYILFKLLSMSRACKNGMKEDV